jgi:nucleoside-diphosphate-sugar epimerase
VLGPEGARFSLLYVEDLAEAILQWLSAESTDQSTYELHDGRPGGYTTTEVAETVARGRGGRVLCLKVPAGVLRFVARLNLSAARAIGYRPMLTPGKVRELRHPDWVCDNTPFSEKTGWTPRVSLEKGLQQTLGWHDQH